MIFYAFMLSAALHLGMLLTAFFLDILGITWGMLGNTVLQSPTKAHTLLGEGNLQMI